MRSFSSVVLLLCSTNVSGFFESKKPIIREPTPPFDNIKFFNGCVLAKEIQPAFLREAELKHGRIAMLATVGWILTLFVNPVLGVGPVEAHNAAVASGAGAQVLTGIAALEFIGTVALKQTFDGKRAPGDFSFDPMNLYGKLDGKGKETMQLKELENGRLAMMAFSGLVTVAVALPDKAFPYF